jgi:hypothetical protein
MDARIVLIVFLCYIFWIEFLKPKQNGSWGSHTPILMTILNNTHGDILELGSGYYSTPLIHQYGSRDRRILTIDSDCKWLQKFRGLENTFHAFTCTQTHHTNLTFTELFYKISPQRIDQAWTMSVPQDHRFGVAFIDHSPGYRRYKDILLLRKTCDILVVHDTDDVLVKRFVFGKKLQDVLNSFKYIYRTKHILPQTTVVSDKICVNAILSSYDF